MNRHIADIAADPLQYDSNELIWETEGRKNSPNRRMFLLYLQPLLSSIPGKRVIDIGCGQGWLCDEIKQNGGDPLGLDPSTKNIQTARTLYPNIVFINKSLQEYIPKKLFDIAFMVMVETFLDIEKEFKRVAKMLKKDGTFIIIVSDFERSTHIHRDYNLEIESIGPEEVAIKINSGSRFGTLCDIIRTIKKYKQAANNAGFTIQRHTPILPPTWHPRHKTHKNKVLFHLLEFKR